MHQLLHRSSWVTDGEADSSAPVAASPDTHRRYQQGIQIRDPMPYPSLRGILLR